MPPATPQNIRRIPGPHAASEREMYQKQRASFSGMLEEAFPDLPPLPHEEAVSTEEIEALSGMFWPASALELKIRCEMGVEQRRKKSRRRRVEKGHRICVV